MSNANNSIVDDFSSFRETNISSSIFSSVHEETQIMRYMLFIESRISNNLEFLANPSLCQALNLDQESLKEELEILVESRQKISLSSIKNEKLR